MFGKKKKEVAPTTSEAIGKLRETEELLTKKQLYLEKQIEEQMAIAKKKAGKDKRGMYFVQSIILYQSGNFVKILHVIHCQYELFCFHQ